MKKSGRLSKEERQDVLLLIPELNPLAIAEKLNRDIAPIYNWLDLQIPSWREIYKETHNKYIEQEKNVLIGKNEWRVLKKYLPENKEQTKEMDLDDLSTLLNEINDIKSELELRSKMDQKQVSMITNLKDKVEKQLTHQQYKLNEALEIQQVEMNKLALLQMETHAATRAAEQKYSTMRPVPIPEYTRKELLSTKDKEIISDLNKGGLYFLWRDNVVRYVGRGDIIKNRLLNHNKITPNDLVSYIPYDNEKYFVDESYYIWQCYPHNYLNSEVAKALGRISYSNE